MTDMSTTDRASAVRKHVWGETYRALVPVKAERLNNQVSWNELADVLDHLPAHTEVTITFVYAGLSPERTVDLMARDFPGTGRRFTNLTNGTEWFDLTGIFNADSPVVLYIVAQRRNDDSSPVITGVRPT